MTTATIEQAREIGATIGQAMAQTVLATPDMDRAWDGLDAQDGDRLTAAGIEPGSDEWDAAEEAAEEAYRAALPDVWTLELSYEDGGGETYQFGAERPDDDDIKEKCRADAQVGEWGDNGASVPVEWTLRNNGTEIDTGEVTVEIEPDHDGMIRAACDSDQWDRCCGGDPEDHDWTCEGEGGCDENPGVWSVGGTALVVASHCRTCGLRRRQEYTGSQRNPGEHDTVTYTMPETAGCGQDADE